MRIFNANLYKFLCVKLQRINSLSRLYEGRNKDQLLIKGNSGEDHGACTHDVSEMRMSPIKDTDNAEWIKGDGLIIDSYTLSQSILPLEKITSIAIAKEASLLEAWISSHKVSQDGSMGSSLSEKSHKNCNPVLTHVSPNVEDLCLLF